MSRPIPETNECRCLSPNFLEAKGYQFVDGCSGYKVSCQCGGFKWFPYWAVKAMSIYIKGYRSKKQEEK